MLTSAAGEYTGLRLALFHGDRVVHGIQVGFFTAEVVKNPDRGVASENERTEEIMGAQFGGACLARHATGLQFGLVASAQELHGVQVSALGNAVETGAGLQLSLAVNRGRMTGRRVDGGNGYAGVQAAPFNFMNSISGMQIGLVNAADHLSGPQVGLTSHARQAHGLQFGVINLADELHGVKSASSIS